MYGNTYSMVRTLYEVQVNPAPSLFMHIDHNEQNFAKFIMKPKQQIHGTRIHITHDWKRKKFTTKKNAFNLPWGDHEQVQLLWQQP